MKKPVVVEFTWSEAMNLAVVASQANTTGWTRAAKGALLRAIQKLGEAIPMDDPNAVFLVVRGQTVVGPVERAIGDGSIGTGPDRNQEPR